MRNWIFWVVAGAVAAVACAPTTPPPMPATPDPPPVAEAERPDVRDLPLRPSFLAAVEAGTRTMDGRPGPAYWQQRVRYDLHVELDPAAAVLHGSGRIRYHNESPDTLPGLVLNLYQNVFAPGVRRNRFVTVTGGTTLHRVTTQGRTLEPGTDALRVDGTIARLALPRPVPPGGTVDLEIDWSNPVPPAGTFRTAWEDALGGRAFHVAQWYPQVATYDDIRGWDTGPYQGDGEFYLEYGDFDVTISVPQGWLVAATGELSNPGEVLTDEAVRRLAAAPGRDGVSRIVTGADLDAGNATQPSMDGRLAWRFRAADVRDFAFATSDRYVWDVASARIPVADGRTRSVPVHALYRPGAPHWHEAADYARHALELFHTMLLPYAYPQVTVAEGPVFGMEYPMVNFIGKPERDVALHSVIAHEVAHQWYPMMVGTDEAADAWIDEGLASWLDALATADRFPGQDPFASYLASYLALAGTEAEVPITRHTDLVTPYGSRAVAAYRKPALLFRALREVLGPDTFHDALDTFTREWMFRHPMPWDLFHTFERVSGEDLTWFWSPWFFETSVLDRSIESVERENGVVRVTVHDRGEIAVPTEVVLSTADGRTYRDVIPVEVWLEGRRRAEVAFEIGEAEVSRIEIDPRFVFPDVTPEANVWRPADRR